METNNSVPFRLLGLKTIQYAIFDSVHIEHDNVDLETSLSFGLDTNKQIVGVSTRFTFNCDNVPFLLIELRCDFNIEMNSWKNFQVAPEKMVFPKILMEHLATITVGSCRGALHAKTEGTTYNSYVIPTINLTEFITDDVGFDLNDLTEG
jgi:hypothetical protein